MYAGVGRKLVDSLRNETIVEDDARARRVRGPPARRPRGDRPRARVRGHAIAETRWSDEAFAEQPPYGGVRRGSRLVDSRSISRRGAAGAGAFAPIQAIGGETGWYKGALLWRLRGLLDVLVGGPGLRRGRRDPVGLEVGDTVDFWRVEAFEPDRLLRLSAEMKVPGRAWLQFEVSPDAAAVGLDRHPDGDLRPLRAVRPRLLVRAVAVPRLHLRRRMLQEHRSRRARARRTEPLTCTESAQTRSHLPL